MAKQNNEQELQEKEARVNALRQLLSNSQKDLLAGYEGLLTQTEFDELKELRRNWFEELAELEGDTPDPEEPMAVPILEQIEGMTDGGGGGSFPKSKYSPEEIVGAVEGLIDGTLGGA